MAGRRHCRPGSAPVILWRRVRVRLSFARALLTPGSHSADALTQRISAMEGSAAFVKKKEQNKRAVSAPLPKARTVQGPR